MSGVTSAAHGPDGTAVAGSGNQLEGALAGPRELSWDEWCRQATIAIVAPIDLRHHLYETRRTIAAETGSLESTGICGLRSAVYVATYRAWRDAILAGSAADEAAQAAWRAVFGADPQPKDLQLRARAADILRDYLAGVVSDDDRWWVAIYSGRVPDRGVTVAALHSPAPRWRTRHGWELVAIPAPVAAVTKERSDALLCAPTRWRRGEQPDGEALAAQWELAAVLVDDGGQFAQDPAAAWEAAGAVLAGAGDERVSVGSGRDVTIVP